MNEKSGPDPIDVGVGLTLRRLRKQQGISQQALGTSLGLTFQQIQKYEHGRNRISASMLVKAARALNVPASRLLPDQDGVEAPETTAVEMAAKGVKTSGAHELLEAFTAIPSLEDRRAILDIAKSLASARRERGSPQED